MRREYALLGGIWLLLAISLALNLSDLFAPFLALRLVLGLVAIVYIPGYFLQSVFFPRTQHLTGLERFVISVGLSLAIIPIIVLSLDYAALGFHTEVAAVALGVVSLILAVVSYVRRRSIPQDERYVLINNLPTIHLRSVNRLLVVVIALAGIALVTGVIIFVLPKPSSELTEFFLLDSTGGTTNYPKQIRVNERATLELEIVNQEGTSESYRVEVVKGDQVLATSPMIELQHGQNAEESISFVLNEVANQQEIMFNLYKGEDSEPYRILHLWIDVAPSG